MPADPTPSQMDRLTSQLYHLSAIIGRMGLSIAEAQKELDANFLDGAARVLEMARSTAGASAKFDDLRPMLEMLLPSRYQFTETTIEFSADLAEKTAVTGGGTAGAAIGAFFVNASLAFSYGRDYRAAARITSVIHAYTPTNGANGKELLARAKELAPVALPENTKADQQLIDNWNKLVEQVKK